MRHLSYSGRTAGRYCENPPPRRLFHRHGLAGLPLLVAIKTKPSIMMGRGDYTGCAPLRTWEAYALGCFPRSVTERTETLFLDLALVLVKRIITCCYRVPQAPARMAWCRTL
ncbi:hypothetical protein NDU88_001676 [Pleurodeles waltl]|uniref:Uncharacterized protein n=1 Tax=Pleurodeles waltl TaxID=8319 RepID=A0AAV7LYA8_PLEWA|nr:hypothetical protein NDU88_001676 [Pleurodeles waltl]